MIDIDNYVHIRQATKQGFIKKVGQISNDGSEYGTVLDSQGIQGNLVAGTRGYANNVIHHRYRIRKLTALECFRLMSFDDEDYFAAAEENSETQLYKEAGNSIVVSVLVAIFSQMGIGKKWNDLSDENKERLSENRMREETST